MADKKHLLDGGTQTPEQKTLEIIVSSVLTGNPLKKFGDKDKSTVVVDDKVWQDLNKKYGFGGSEKLKADSALTGKAGLDNANSYLIFPMPRIKAEIKDDLTVQIKKGPEIKDKDNDGNQYTATSESRDFMVKNAGSVGGLVRYGVEYTAGPNKGTTFQRTVVSIVGDKAGEYKTMLLDRSMSGEGKDRKELGKRTIFAEIKGNEIILDVKYEGNLKDKFISKTLTYDAKTGKLKSDSSKKRGELEDKDMETLRNPEKATRVVLESAKPGSSATASAGKSEPNELFDTLLKGMKEVATSTVPYGKAGEVAATSVMI